ncbi:MAG: hypothetical protein GEU80_16870, partial [Dehalococcoidia bacterium]|nr:hypothetical protein [Dehalococcoidia bacterium]
MVQADAPAKDEGGPPPDFQMPDLSWMTKTIGWGVRARPEPNGGGLTIDRLNVGVYAEVPD